MPAKKVPITEEQLRQVQVLAELGLSNADIAIVVKLDRRTMERRCAEQLECGRAGMRSKLCKIQWEMAAKSPAMAIWLGKQYLGQRDQPLPPGQEGATIEYVQRIITTPTSNPTVETNAPGATGAASAPGSVPEQPGTTSGFGSGTGGG